MIFDRLENFPLYFPLHPHFADAWNFLQNCDPEQLVQGRHEVNAGGAFALVSEYFTREVADSFIECHRKYIDIQLLARGEEAVGFSSRIECLELPYDEERDFLELEGSTDLITLRPGSFLIFFPDDGHMSMLRLGETSSQVKKIVFKIPVSFTEE